MNVWTLFYGYLHLWLSILLILVIPPCIGENEKPHFQVDHTAGKLDIQATKETADITFGNDKVDLLLKPGDTVVPTISIVHKTGSEKSAIETNKTATPQVKEEIHEGNETNEGLLRIDNSTRNATENSTLSSAISKNENTSDITWKGRLNHKSDDHTTTSVLQTLDEIKSLMTQSIQKTQDDSKNEESSQRFGSSSHDEYLDAANAIIKKVEQQQGTSLSKFSENNSEDTDYVGKAQEILNRYKQMEKKNSSVKYIDEGTGDGKDSMAKYDITALTTNNTAQETAPAEIITPVLRLPSNRDDGPNLQNHTKNGLHNKNFTIVPLKTQKISYEFSKVKGDSPRIVSNNQVNNKNKILNENATQSDRIEKKQRQTNNEVIESKSKEMKDAEFVKTNSSRAESKEDQKKLIKDSDKNSDISSTHAEVSEFSNSKKQDDNKPAKEVGKQKDDSTEMSERAYASIDIDPEAVRNATIEKQKIVTEKAPEEKKNPSEEEVYATIDNNLTRNKTKEELENATRALNHTEEERHSKDWTNYVYHEGKSDEKKLREHHLKRLIAWAPVKSASENRVNRNKQPRYRNHHKKTKNENVKYGESKTDNEVGLSRAERRKESNSEREAGKINSGKANEFFKSQEEMESQALCRGLKDCEKRNSQKSNKTKMLSEKEKQQEGEVANEAKIENRETAAEEKVTQTALQHAKELANDVARELNKTDVNPDSYGNVTTKVEMHDTSDVDKNRESIHSESLLQHKVVATSENDTTASSTPTESELKWNTDSAPSKENELKSIKKEEADLTQEEKVKMAHEKEWSVEPASLKVPADANYTIGSEKKNFTKNNTVEETDILPAKENDTSEYINGKKNSSEHMSANQSKEAVTSTNENAKEIDEKESDASPSDDKRNQTKHEVVKSKPESYAKDNAVLTKVNSFLSNGEEKVEETYGPRDKYMEGKVNDHISSFSAKQSVEEFRDGTKVTNSKDEDENKYKAKDLAGMVTIEKQDTDSENVIPKKKKEKKKRKHKSLLKKLYSKKKKKTVSAKKKHTTDTKQEYKQKIREEDQKKKDRLFSVSQKESSDAEQILKTLDENSAVGNTSTKALLSMSIDVANPVAAQQQKKPEPLNQNVLSDETKSQQQTSVTPQMQPNLSLTPVLPPTTENASPKPSKQDSEVKETSEDVFPEVKNETKNSLANHTSKLSKEQFEFLELEPPAVTENHLDLGKTGDKPGMFPAEIRKELQDKQIDAPSLSAMDKLKKESKHYVKPKVTKDQGQGSNYAATVNEVTNTSNTEQRHLKSDKEEVSSHSGEEQKKKEEEEGDAANILTKDVSKAMEELEVLMKEKTAEVNKIAQENAEEKSVENQTAESVLKELNDNGEEQNKPAKLNFLDPKHLKPLEDDPIKALALFRRNATTDTGIEDFEENNDMKKVEAGGRKKYKGKHRLHHSKHHNRSPEKKKTIPTEKNIEDILKEANNFKLVEEERLNHAKDTDNKIQEKVVEKILSKYMYASELLKKKLHELKEQNKRSNETKVDVNVGETSPMNETSADFYIKESNNATNSEKSSNENVIDTSDDKKLPKEKEKTKEALSSLENHEHKSKGKNKGKNQKSNEKEDNNQSESPTVEQPNLKENMNTENINNENINTDQTDEQFTNYLIGNAPDSSIKEAPDSSIKDTPDSNIKETSDSSIKETSDNNIKGTSDDAYNLNTKSKEDNSVGTDNKSMSDKDDRELNEVNKEIDSMSDEVRKIEKQTQDNTSTLSWKSQDNTSTLSWKTDDVKPENQSVSPHDTSEIKSAAFTANTTKTSNSSTGDGVGSAPSLLIDKEASNNTKMSDENSKTDERSDKSSESEIEAKPSPESKQTSDDVNNTTSNQASDDVNNTTKDESQANQRQQENQSIEKGVEQNMDENSTNAPQKDLQEEAKPVSDKQSSQISSSQTNNPEQQDVSSLISKQDQKSTDQMSANQDGRSEQFNENIDKKKNKDMENTSIYDVNKNTDKHETDLEKSATSQEVDNKHNGEQEEKQGFMATGEQNDLQKQFEAGQNPQVNNDQQLHTNGVDNKEESNNGAVEVNNSQNFQEASKQADGDQKQTKGEESMSFKENTNEGKSREKNEVKEGASTLEDNQQIIDVDKTNLDQTDQKMISQLAEGKQEQPSDLIKEIKADFDKQNEVSDEMKEYSQKEREAAEKALEDMNRLTQEGDYIENKPNEQMHHGSKHHREKLQHESSMLVNTNNKLDEGRMKDKQEMENITDQKTEETTAMYTPTVGSHLEKDESLHPTLGIVPNKAIKETAEDYVSTHSDDSNEQNGNQIKHKEEIKTSSNKNAQEEESKESSAKSSEGKDNAKNTDKEESHARKNEEEQSKHRKNNNNEKKTHEGNTGGENAEKTSKLQKESEEKSSKNDDLLNLENLAKHFTNNDLAELFTNRSKNDTSDEKALEAATDAILKTSTLMKDMKAIDQKDSKQNFHQEVTVDPYSTFKRSLRRSKKRKFG